MADFIRVTLRSLRGHPSGYRIPLNTVQRGAAKDLQVLLQAKPPTEGAEIAKSVHSLLLTVFARAEEEEEGDGGGSQWDCPVQCFLAAYALQENGNFMSPETLTGVLAKFKYLAYTVAISEAKNNSGKHPDKMIG